MTGWDETVEHYEVEANVVAFVVLVACAISSVLWWMEHGEDGN